MLYIYILVKVLHLDTVEGTCVFLYQQCYYYFLKSFFIHEITR